MSYIGYRNTDPNDKPKLSDLQKKAAEMADDLCTNSAWYRGIYIADIPSDGEILSRGIEEVAAELAEITATINY